MCQFTYYNKLIAKESKPFDQSIWLLEPHKVNRYSAPIGVVYPSGALITLSHSGREEVNGIMLTSIKKSFSIYFASKS